MKFALEKQHNQSKNDFKFQLTLANINTVDAYKLSRIILEALNNKSITMKKTNFAKKRVNRFYINKNCSLYLNYIKKIFYE